MYCDDHYDELFIVNHNEESLFNQSKFHTNIMKKKETNQERKTLGNEDGRDLHIISLSILPHAM